MVEEKYNIYTFTNNKWIKVNRDINAYDKSEVDSLLAVKADISGVYSKSEIDGMIGDIFEEDDYYTKTACDGLLALKADSNTVTTLSGQINTNTSDISTLQTTVTNLGDTYYNKTEVNSAITNAVTTLELYKIVTELPTSDIASNKIYLVPNTKNKTKNKYDLYLHIGEEWEQLDSIELNIEDFASASDMSQAQTDITSIQSSITNLPNTYYNKTEIDAELAKKADKTDTYTKTETDTALGNKADKTDTYTKTEIDNAISTAVAGHSVVEVVSQLPEHGESTKLYLVPVASENNGE